MGAVTSFLVGLGVNASFQGRVLVGIVCLAKSACAPCAIVGLSAILKSTPARGSFPFLRFSVPTRWPLSRLFPFAMKVETSATAGSSHDSRVLQ